MPSKILCFLSSLFQTEHMIAKLEEVPGVRRFVSQNICTYMYSISPLAISACVPLLLAFPTVRVFQSTSHMWCYSSIMEGEKWTTSRWPVAFKYRAQWLSQLLQVHVGC